MSTGTTSKVFSINYFFRILSALTIFALIYSHMANAADVYCPPGNFGGGGYYPNDHTCFNGVILGKNQNYCPQGALRSGGVYDTTGHYCLEGMILSLKEKYCPKGALRSGGVYDTSSSYCFEGIILSLNERYCPKGDLGGGGVYTTPGYYCLDGLILDKDARYCPKSSRSSGRIYYPAIDHCNSLPPLTGAALVLSSYGDVVLTDRKGKHRQLEAGDSIAEGDSLKTGSDGRVTLGLEDQSTIQLAIDSDLTVIESKFNKSGCPSIDACRSFLKLANGALRWITGKRTFKDGFKLTTPSTTLGIRGTDFDLYHITDKEKYGGADVGTYVKVNQGIIFVESGGSQINVTQDQVIYVKDKTTVPVLIEQLPISLIGIN